VRHLTDPLFVRLLEAAPDATACVDSDEGILVSAAIRGVSERLELLADRDRPKTKAERDRLERQHRQARQLESLGQLAGAVVDDYNKLLAFAPREVATSQPAQEIPPTPPAAEDGAGETVLVVEDENALREMICRMLARHGYQVITAANGRDAVEVAASHRGGIDLLVTDVIMPQMSGKEAAERIRALCPSVKVLFMSGYTEGILSAQGVLEAGINLIEKPFTEKSLLAKLRGVIALGPGR
jgi:CheY-like chemotaxis protein